jgi:hypothetical protein
VDDRLSPLQHDALLLFFSLPESESYVLTGAAAMLLAGLIERPTADIDLMTTLDTASVGVAADAFVAAAREAGWTVEVQRQFASFSRLQVSRGDEAIDVDLVQDAPPVSPVVETSLGPSLSPDDLAARKTLALFGRAEARDFVDVYTIVQRYGRERLLELARLNDGGFDRRMFAGMLDQISRIADARLPIDPSSVADVREYFADWSRELRAAPPRAPGPGELPDQGPSHRPRR